MVSGRHTWTEAEDAILREGYDRGWPCDYIGKRLNLGRTAVQARARILNLRHPQYDKSTPTRRVTMPGARDDR